MEVLGHDRGMGPRRKRRNPSGWFQGAPLTEAFLEVCRPPGPETQVLLSASPVVIFGARFQGRKPKFRKTRTHVVLNYSPLFAKTAKAFNYLGVSFLELVPFLSAFGKKKKRETIIPYFPSLRRVGFAWLLPTPLCKKLCFLWVQWAIHLFPRKSSPKIGYQMALKFVACMGNTREAFGHTSMMQPTQAPSAASNKPHTP